MLSRGTCALEDHPRLPVNTKPSARSWGTRSASRISRAITSALPDLWLSQFLEKLPPLEPPLTWSKGDNPKKNSLEYHCVQHQKFAWLSRAANEDQESDTFVWIDYGIASQPGFNADDLQAFLSAFGRTTSRCPVVGQP